jgi:transposase
MNHYFNQLIMYHEIHQQKRTGKQPSQIASFLSMDTRTVKKYLAMSEQEFDTYQVKLEQRTRKLAEYEDFVHRRLADCTEASSAQVHDWLKECHPDFEDVSIKTVYNFVLLVRNKYRIPKVFDNRQYTAVAELPYGAQAQADFGEYNMTDTEGRRKKVYFFAIVLSRSRHKYVCFSDIPFTTLMAIQAHEEAFAFFGGIPGEIVYDQDKLLLVSENMGDLLLTEAFRSYRQYRGFELYFCRKNDPQSKGKIENVIGYIKYNFLRGRTYFDNPTLNAQGIDWLARTANAKEHATTRKIPVLEWAIEKAHLKPLLNSYIMQQEDNSTGVRKDNTIQYKGTKYTLPTGTYQGPLTRVFIKQQEDMLIISDSQGSIIAKHLVSSLKGITVRNNNHRRDHSHKIAELIRQASLLFSDPPAACIYLEQIRDNKPRYIRDQIKLITSLAGKYIRQDMDRALKYCLENKITNATDFEPVLLTLANDPAAPYKPTENNPVMDKKRYQIYPQKSSISDYKQILN